MNERIKQLRLERGLSQVDLARRLSVSKQSVSNWENDNILPSIEMLVRISRLFSVSTVSCWGRSTDSTLRLLG